MDSGFQVLQQSPGRLVVLAPGSSLLSGWLVLALLAFFLLIGFTADRSTRRVMALSKSPAQLSSFMLRFRLGGAGIVFGSLALFWALSYSSGSITLDRQQATARIQTRMTVFLPARSVSAPLTAVSAALLDYKPNAQRIRLVCSHGPDLAYPIWSSRQGQSEAVQALNAFLTHSSGRS